MAKIIAVANQKGGVGKTTTAVNLASSLGLLGLRVLLVDFDPQGNATSGVGLNKKELASSVYEVILTGGDVKSAIAHTQYGLDILPSNINLAGAEIELANLDNREYRLKWALDSLRDDYDYIIIDCPPSLGLLSLNSLTAADGVLMPVQCEFYALEGISELMNTIRLVNDGINPDLTIFGILLTMYDSRTNLSAQVAEEVRKYFPDKVFKAVIPRTVRLAEAPSYGMPVAFYDNNAKGSETYKDLAQEVIFRD
ncbi:MAG: ParA family protein [Schwartzia sp.]|nr:ParA family protein [Schwartzia sp. (in: firmicutes)]